MSDMHIDDLKVAVSEAIPFIVADDEGVGNAALSLAAATGSVCEELAGISASDLVDALTDPEVLDRLVDEIALVALHLQHLATLTGINLGNAVEGHLARVRRN